MTRRSRIPRAAAAVLLLVGPASCSTSFGIPRGGTAQSEDTFELWRVFFLSAAVVASIVYGLIFWCVIRYRRREGDDPDAQGSQVRANVPIEVLYSVLPFVLATTLFVLTFRTEQVIDDVSPNPDMVLNVEGFAWGWRFTYPDEGVSVVSPPSGEGIAGPEIVLPLGRTIRVVLTSDDVIHAFWVPEFLFKRDAIPGRPTRFDLTTTEPGTFRGQCAEFCGLNHAYMTFSVRVASPAEYEAWLDAQRSAAAAA
jgi:cytochrome c oxidase subunit 2